MGRNQGFSSPGSDLFIIAELVSRWQLEDTPWGGLHWCFSGWFLVVLVSSVFYGDGMACDRRFSTRRWMCCVAMVLVVSGECRFAQVDGSV